MPDEPSNPKSIAECRERVKKYINGVVDGSIVTGRLVRLAVERHNRDIEFGDQRGLRFDETHGWQAVAAFNLFKHTKGKWGPSRGRPAKTFALSDFQIFMTWSLFGWLRADGTRRFRVAYIEMARKGGKSTYLAALGVIMFMLDGEPGAEVFTAATKREQARIVHSEAINMIQSSPALSRRCRINKDDILHLESKSFFKPLGQDANSTDGLNPHCAIVDELHAHTSGDMWNVLDTGMGARSQPMIIAITTAGKDTESFCYYQREYGIKLLEGSVENDDWFVYIAAIDDADNWRDESCWIKANPNLGVSIGIEDLRRQFKAAVDNPPLLNDFLTKRLNIWTKVGTGAFTREQWNRCSDTFDIANLAGRECFAALDLSRTRDTTALGLIFPPKEPGEAWKYHCEFFLPEKTIEDMAGDTARMYRQWAKEGVLTLTPGGEVHYSYVRRRIAELCNTFSVQRIVYDPWNATETAETLEAAGFPMVRFAQSWLNYNEPTKLMIEMIRDAQLAHGGNPMLKDQAMSLEVKSDNNGNMRPIKPDTFKSQKRIDGMVALIMSIGAARCGERAQEIEVAVF